MTPLCVYTRRHHRRYETQTSECRERYPRWRKERWWWWWFVDISQWSSWTFIKFNCHNNNKSLSQVMGYNHNFEYWEDGFKKRREIYYPFICFVFYYGKEMFFERERADRAWPYKALGNEPADIYASYYYYYYHDYRYISVFFLLLIFIYRSLLLFPKVFFVFLNDFPLLLLLLLLLPNFGETLNVWQLSFFSFFSCLNKKNKSKKKRREKKKKKQVIAFFFCFVLFVCFYFLLV